MLENKKEKAYVALVGAGPGDPELITVRGWRLIQDCDVLVYDNLMADEFIALSNAKEKIFVGKSSGCHALVQEKINQLLVDKALENKKVVRLKGGDPFVFGRGGEECAALKKAGVPYEVVPGLTAGIAGSAYGGIPVTHREISRGVTLLTGHFAKDKEVELPWKALAGLGHTLVFYMSIGSLDKVSSFLIEAGMSGKTPAAVIERATTSTQREIISDLANIAEEIKKKGVRPPGLFIVGDVVNLHDELKWMEYRPLAGKGIMFTRALESSYDDIHELRKLGAEVLEVPVIKTVPRTDDQSVSDAFDQLDEFSCIAFTSALGVDIFFKAMYFRKMDVRKLHDCILASGSRTVSKALKEHGVVADVVPELAGAGQLVKALKDYGLENGAKVLLPRSSSADSALPDSIKSAGFKPHVLDIYDALETDMSWLKVKLANWNPDAILFLSGTGVRAVINAAPQLKDSGALFACVGNKTAASLKELGIEPDILPDYPDVNSLVSDVIRRLTD